MAKQVKSKQFDKQELSEADFIKECHSWSPKAFVTLYELLQQDYKFPQHMYPLALALCDWRIKMLMEIVSPGSGKSVTTSQVFPSVTLGHNPEENIICVSGAEQLAIGFQQVVSSHIADNESFHKIFPKVKPDKQRGWSNTSGIFVTGHRPSSPDASFWSAGISSKAITGKHGTVIIADDLHTPENSATEEACAQVVRTFVSQIMGRQDPRGARFIVTGRRWHESDLYGRLKDNGDFVCLTLPAERPNSKRLWYDIVIPEGLGCVFTDGKCKPPDSDELIEVPDAIQTALVVNKKARIETKENGVALRHIEWPYGIDPKGEGFFWPQMEAKRREYFSAKRLEPAAAEAVYQCNPSARQGSVFLESDFARRYVPVENQELGMANPAVAAMCRRDGGFVVQGWDTAFSSNATSDHSVCVTLLLIPCDQYHKGEDAEKYGPCEQHFDCLVLDVWRDRVNYAEVERQMRAQYHIWQPATVIIENKAYGVTAIENLQKLGMPIESVTPSALESKRARAVEGISGSSVQGWARSWRICLPETAEWVDKFIREMKDFSGAPGGTDDQVDALVHSVRWAIQNGGGVNLPGDWGDPGKIDNLIRGDSVTPDAMANFLGGFADLAFDPFGDCCGRCRHFAGLVRDKKLPTNRDIVKIPRNYCLLHNRPTQAIGSCDDHMEPDSLISHPFFGA